MFEFLSKIYSSLSSTTAAFSSEAIAAQIGGFRTLINDGHDDHKTIRLWVDAGASYGHQSSTVNLMYRLARPAGADNLTFGYTGTIELYYQEDAEEAKLKELIPEISGSAPYKVDEATIVLIRYAGKPSTEVAFGMTGGASVDRDYTDALQVKTFLRLQPFNWPGAEEIAFAGGAPAIDLLAVPEVGAGAFKRRLYAMDPSIYQAPPWDTYLAGGYSDLAKEKLKIVRHLTGDDVLGAFALQTVYSIKTGSPRFSQDTAFGASMIVGGALEWQIARSGSGDAPYKKAKPVVIVNFDEFGTPEASAEADLRSVLTGGFGPSEFGFKLKVQQKNPDAVSNYGRRKAYFESLRSADRLVYLNYPETLERVTDALDAISGGDRPNDKVLFVQLGRSFPACFSHAIYRSSLPPIFEGQNTANLCVNVGRPYMQIPGTKDTESERLRIYPAVTLARYTSQQVPAGLIEIASQVSRSPEVWPTAARDAPPRVIGEYFQQYTDEAPGKGTIQNYFKNLNAFFARASEDKLSVAVSYMNTRLPAEDGAPMALAADPNPLDALYDAIAAAVSAGGEILLVPGILAGGDIPDFIVAFLKEFGGTLALAKATVFEPATKPAQPVSITLAGPTSAFKAIGVDCDVEVIFTAPENVLTADVTFTAVGDWAMPGAPWMVFHRPYIALTLAEGKRPVAAAMGGFYAALESADPPVVARLDILIGGDAGSWPAILSFEKTYPSIASGYQLLTGYNVIRSLPAPFNVLADLGISNIDIDYDHAEKTVNSLVVVAQNNTENLPLFGDLSLKNIIVTAIVSEPTKARKLAVGASAEFGIGRTDPAVATVSIAYPDIVLKGGLTSGVLTPSKILQTFVPAIDDLMLPHEPVIDAFSFMYDKPNDDLAVSMNMTMPDWDFTFPFTARPLFSLDGVGFAISRDKGRNSGNITARTTLLPSSRAPIGVDIGAYYLEDKSWRFVAATTTPVDLDTLVKDYLGDGWVPAGLTFPKLRDVGATLVWGKAGGATAKAQSFEFKAKTAEPWQPIAALGAGLSATFDLTIGYRAAKAGASALVVVGGPGSRASTALMLRAEEDEPAGLYGKLLADVTLWHIDLGIEYDFDPKRQKVIVIWTDVGLKAVVETSTEPETKGDTIATFSLDGETVGSIVEKFVGWATGTKFGLMAPWNILDDIKLSGLGITYNFTKKTVDFDIAIGPVDLGLFKLNGITLAYNPQGNPDAKAVGGRSRNKVAIGIDGSFAWESGDKVSWEPDDPSTTPAPPGGGNKYFDLRLLALGQHVTVKDLVAQKSVTDVIAMLEVLDIPQPPDVPLGGPKQPSFDKDSSWFVAFDFGILKVEKEKKNEAVALAIDRNGDLVPASGRALALADADPGEEEGEDSYFISLAIVFNDPHLYALRIGLAGPMAKIFAGLDFQIMYQQVAKNVGKYSAELVLPDIMRKFQIGVASITLPKFAIEVYTNGDFQVDIGFPWKEDFSLSFSIEFMAGPIPVVGSAGFYFGKLSSATTTKVPATTTGWFNPVIVFGFGAQVGLGKSIEMGILRAGFSLTVFGIIEGVIARWLPYIGPTPGGQIGELQDGYYFSLTGTVGVQGRLYGSINFAIISAELDISISLYVRITFASYEPIPITAKASVDVSLSIRINLGLFKITIHLGFRAEVETTFVLDNPMKGNPPWHDPSRQLQAAAMPAARLSARGLARIAPRTPMLAAMAAGAYSPTWSNLSAGPKLGLKGWMVPVLTVAGDVATVPAEQEICYVVNFFLEGEKPIQEHREAVAGALHGTLASAHRVAPESVAQAALHRARPALRGAEAMSATGADTFEDLAVRVLQWVIAAGQGGAMDIGQVDELVVDDALLASALDYLAAGPVPMPQGDVSAFLSAQTEILFSLQQEACKGDDDVPVVFFPAAPAIKLDVPSFNGSTPYAYTFGGYNTSTSGYLGALNGYFNQLKVQIEAESAPQAFAASAATPDGPSIASYIFGDYFAMIGRLTIQAMRDGLRNFKLPIADYAGRTVQEIVDEINDPLMQDPAPGDAAYTVGELFSANQRHALSVEASPALTVSGMDWPVAGGASFEDVAKAAVFGGSVTARNLALHNAANGKLLAAGIVLAGNGRSHTTQTADSLETVAIALGYGTPEAPDVGKLLDGVPIILTDKALLAAPAIVSIPDFPHAVSAGDTLQAIAQTYGIDLDALAGANGAVKNLFDGGSTSASDPNLSVPHLSRYKVGRLIDEMKRTLALQHISAQVSRYYLHGLRLPTSFDGSAERLVANADGLFAKAGSPYPEDLGLFALTGQAFPLPEIADPAGRDGSFFTFSVSVSGESWLSLGSPGGGEIDFSLDGSQANVNYLQYAAVKAAAHGGYLDTGTIGLRPLVAAGLTPTRYPLSREIAWQPAVAMALPVTKSVPATPRPRLWSLPNELINTPHGGGVLPTIKPVLARTDEAKGITVDQDVGNYGFGSLVSFKIKRLQDGAATGLSQRTYEIIGAPESEITLLERVLDQLRSDASAFRSVGLFYRPRATGSLAGGWQSDDASASLMGITQTNLSTETRPPVAAARLFAAAADARSLDNLIGSPNAFLRLLWEASITRQGGFFLNYTTGIGGELRGLPDHVFNDRGEAEVAVFALYGLSSAAGLSVANYMNVAVTDEPFDLSDAALIAAAVPVPLAAGRNFVPGEDTLSSYAASYYMGPGVLAGENADLAFRPGARVVVEGGFYQVPAAPPASPDIAAPGGDLALIAQHFETTVEAVRNANIAGAALPATLAPLTAIKLPRVAVTIGATRAGGSFAALSAYFNAPIAELAAANAESNAEAGLFPSVPLKVVTGPVSLAPQLRQGVAGIVLQRPAPAVPDAAVPDAGWAKAYLRQSFGLLGYRIAENAGNVYFEESNWGLPSGPINPDPDTGGDKLQAPRSAGVDDVWHFSLTVPYAAVLARTEADANPYLGVGSLLQLDLAWLDIFGNRALGEFQNPTPPASAPLNKAPQITGYTDPLFGIGQWPSVSHAYRVTTKDGGPQLSLELNFAKAIYDAAAAAANGSDQGAATAGRNRLRQGIDAYARIAVQLGDPAGVVVELGSTIMPGVVWTIPSLDGENDKAGLNQWAASILAYLKALLAGTTPPALQTDFVHAVSLDAAKLNDGQIFKLTATLSIARAPSLVAGELRTAPGVTRAATVLAPWTGPLDDAGAGQRGLTQFARDFAGAFASVSGHRLRIATGSDRDVFTGGANKPLWVVQLGAEAGKDAISFTIADAGNPTVYAPRPISNVLKSKARTPLIPYTSGQRFDPEAEPEFTAFASIDLDKWMSTTLAFVDDLLTPRYVVPADILRRNIRSVPNGGEPWPDALQRVLDAKESLARALKTAMIPVYVGPTPSDLQSADMQEAFYQGMLGTLGQFYAVTAGIQFTADVAAAIARPPSSTHVPRVFGEMRLTTPPAAVFATASGAATVAGKGVSISSPKFDLKFAADGGTIDPPSPYLSSLVSAASSDAKYVTLDLAYDGQYIEHEIGALPGIEGYKPSSWLSFVETGDADKPFHAELGRFDMPIVLRAFPATPSLVSQDSAGVPASACYRPIPPAPGDADEKTLLTAGSCEKPGSYNPLAAATRWAYAFKYAMQVHEQQDAVHGTIAFNIRDPGVRISAMGLQRDLFDNLAEFVQVYPKVQADLDAHLAAIDVDTTGPDNEATLRTAQYALEAAGLMIRMVADTAAVLGRDSGADAVRSGDGAVGDAVLPVAFTISESEVAMPVGGASASDTVDALKVTVTLMQALPPRVGSPFVEIDGYDCRRVGPDDPLAFGFVFVDAEGAYLPASVGRTIPGRGLVLPDLEIMERQDALTSIHLTRNAGIVPTKTIAGPFVYQTPEIAFESPLHPTLVGGDAGSEGGGIDLATIYSTGPDAPVRRSLECQLTLFYEALFAHAGTDDVTMQLGLYYEYSINDALSPIRLPVFLMPPVRTAIRAGGEGTPLPDLVANQVSAWDGWFEANTPETTAGRLCLDLTVMSDLTARPMPILKLPGLFLMVADIA